MFRSRNVTAMTLIFVACAVLAATPAWAYVVTVNATADTGIYEGTPANGYSDYNYGGAPYVYYGSAGAGGDQGGRILTKFELPGLPDNVVIDSAIHSMRVSQQSGIFDTGGTIDIYRMLTPWVEGTANPATTGIPGTTGTTWNSPNKAGTALWATGGASGAGIDRAATPTDTFHPLGQVNVTFNVTSDVAAMYAGTATNYGWVSQATNNFTTGYVAIGTKENASPLFTPTLTLNYHFPELPYREWKIGKPVVTYYAGPGGAENLTQAAAQQVANGGWNLPWAKNETEVVIAGMHNMRAMWKGALDDSTIKYVRNYSNIYAYYVADEPSASRFTELAATVSRLRELDPGRLAYINLFPCYADSDDLGTSDYRTYLSDYMRIVKPAMLSYDHYHFFVGKDKPDYFKNLALISHTAKQAGIPFMNVVQSCSWDSDVRVPNANELRFLRYTSLAYGAQGVSDFVYYMNGFSGGMVLADQTTTTALYDAAKTVNREFVAIATQVQPLRHIGAYHMGDLPPGYGTTDGSSPMRLPANSPFQLSTSISDSDYQTNMPVRGAVFGLFGPDDLLANATYALLVNLNYSSPLQTRITGPGDLSVFDPVTGIWTAQGHAWADVYLLEGGGVLVGLTAVVPEPSAITLLFMGFLGVLVYACWRRVGMKASEGGLWLQYRERGKMPRR